MMRTLIENMPYALVKHLPYLDLLVPYYHVISDAPVPHVKHLYEHKGVQEFGEDVDFLLRHYTAIGLPDLLDALREGRTLPKRSLLLTFDDGFREMAEIVAPLLRAKGVPAAFFITSAFTDNRALCYQHAASVVAERLTKDLSPVLAEKVRTIIAPTGVDSSDLAAAVVSIPYRHREAVDDVAQVLGVDTQEYLQRERPYLTGEQVTTLVKDGFAVGAHSIDHPLYAALTLEEQLRQTRESVQYVRETYGLGYAAFAFPHHDRGVSRPFFKELFDSGELDISFGTGGPRLDAWPRNIQRISFERPRMAARKIVVYAAARGLYRNITGGAQQLRH